MEKVLKITYALLILLMIFYFVRYNQKTSSEESKPASTIALGTVTEAPVREENFTIGWSVYNSSYEFFRTMQDGVLARAAELGINVITHDQNSSTAEMINGVSNLINQGIDVLVISPFNPNAMPIVVDLANQARVPVVVVDIGTGGTDVAAFIITDSFAGGILAGEYAMELVREHSLTSTNTAIIKVEETAAHARRRGEGFKNVMLENGYNVVAEITANSDQSQAYEAMKEILAGYGDDLAVVFCENDRMALGAAQAIDEAGKRGQIMVIGFDGDTAAIDAIKEGRMQGTVAQQPFEMGELGVDVAYALLTGGRITYDNVEAKELYVEIYLIDETGNPRRYSQ